MRIQHNIMAMNAYRNYNNNTSALSKNLEKLSSGYKINRAGDDAAGLAISEKMRAQITGLEAAQKNVKDGVSLVKTAEGAMQEIQDMLNRMDYLATQSANGTYDEEVDRANLQKEVDALKTEINRIADSANFNGIKLLDGSLSASGASGAAGVPSISGLELTENAAVADKGTLAALTGNTTAFNEGDELNFTIHYTDANGKKQSVTLSAVYSEKDPAETKGALYDKDGNKLASLAGTKGQASATELGTAFEKLAKDALGDSFKVTNAGGALSFESKVKGANMKVDSAIIDWGTAGANQDDALIKVTHNTAGADAYQSINFKDGYTVGDVFTIGGKKFAFAADQDAAVALGKDVNVIVVDNTTGGIDATDKEVAKMADLIEQKTGYKPTVNADNLTLEFKASQGAVAAGGKGGLTLQIGDTADQFNQMMVSVGDMHTKALGIDTLDISEQDGAAAAIETIRDAINTVSSVRGDLGAVQNRLEHTQNNLSVMTENITDAESTIRDTDVAEEMMSYTKNNILIQSAQAMLAQATQVPQGVLQLLQ